MSSSAASRCLRTSFMSSSMTQWWNRAPDSATASWGSSGSPSSNRWMGSSAAAWHLSQPMHGPTSVDDTDTMDTPSSGHSSIQALNSSSASAALRPSARHDPCKITRCMSILSERITARHYSPPCHLPPFPLSQHSTNEPTITNSASPAPPHLCEVVSIQPVARSRQPVHVSLFKSGKFSQVFDIERLRRPLGSRKCRDTR